MNPPARPSAFPAQMADSSARISTRVRPLLRLKSASVLGTQKQGAAAPKSAASLGTQNPKAKRRESKASAPKLTIKESGSKGAPAWTVSIGQKSGKGKAKTSFRVRGSDLGFAVWLHFKNEAGKWRELYGCYLSAAEWKAARRMTPANFTALIVGKVEERKGKEKADAAKLDDLIARTHAIE